MRSPNYDKINEAYAVYAESGEVEAFNELYKLCQPLVEIEALKASREIGNPIEHFRSIFGEAVWEACQGEGVARYDGSSTFMQRVRTFINHRRIDEWRKARRKKRAFREELLDNPINTGDDNECTYADVLGSLDAVAEEVEALDAMERTLESFAKTNERYAVVIRALILSDNDTQELAARLGAESYDDKTRALVSRARKRFAAFLHETA